MLQCRIIGIWYSLRYGMKELLQGQPMLGHDFQYTGEVWKDYWIMECSRCQVRAAIDEAPERTVINK